jgi:hypothetical protein
VSAIGAPGLDEDQARSGRLLLLGKGAVLAHRLARALAAESDESEQSPRREAGDPVRCCHARVRRCRGRSRGCVPRGGERVRVDDDRVSGEFLASWGARFGFLERFLTPWPSVYGTEGQRFESSRARSTEMALESQISCRTVIWTHALGGNRWEQERCHEVTRRPDRAPVAATHSGRNAPER